MKYDIDLSVLNQEQREAVTNIERPMLVLAGAGSGKTRVLTYKIAHLVSRGVQPWKLLAVTFTNKAAREMADRIEKLLDIPVKNLWIGTFHGICLRILRYEADRWGIKKDFTIYDRDDQLSVVKRALKELNVSKDRLSPNQVLGIIGKAKSAMLTTDELAETVSGFDSEIIIKVVKKYNETLRSSGGFDFDDLLNVPVEKFRDDPETLQKWQSKFNHILVDEYQDTNRSQYLLMKMLAGDRGNITVVGDDDQSIYSWRGAVVENILSFENDFKDTKIVKLERNYRSTETILKVANEVVSRNRKRMSKKLWTDGAKGDPVKILPCYNDRDEAETVTGDIQKEQSEKGYELRDFVILYRTNAQSRSFEEVLRRRNIRYMIVGGLKFYERKEIKDILSYLKFLVNPDDIISFERSVGVPKRGLGDKTVEAIENFAVDKNTNVFEIIKDAGSYFNGSTLKKIEDYVQLMKELDSMRGKEPIDKICLSLVNKIGFEEYLMKEFPENYSERIENVHELITAMSEFANEREGDDLSVFMTEVSLMTDVDSWDDDSGALTLMTMHSAKGLEFKSVYIAGVENGLFPLPQSFEDDRQMEEERRLFYVGITRAEKNLHISYADYRERFGSFSGGPSIFLKDIPASLLDKETESKPAIDKTSFGMSKYRRQGVPEYLSSSEAERVIADDFGASGKAGVYKTGTIVSHPLFGRGKITGNSGSGDNLIYTISFSAGTKKISALYGKLTVIK